jgi:hypothetical protein
VPANAKLPRRLKRARIVLAVIAGLLFGVIAVVLICVLVVRLAPGRCVR